MLETITTRCPLCQERTELAISRPDDSGGGGATTACRRCRAHFFTWTTPDGRILILDGSTPLDATGGQPRVLAEIAPAPTRSGYRVRPPDRLDLFSRGRPLPPRAGLPDEDLDQGGVPVGSAMLRRPDGSLRSPSAVAKIFGWRSVWVAQLNEAIDDRLSAPPPLSFPPAIFLSYRWGSDEDNAWVAALARELKARGYPVIFDRDEPTGIDVDVPGLVSRIADCRYFVAILDPGYAARIGAEPSSAIQDGWVFDEYNTAALFSNHQQIRILGFHRHGSSLPRGFRAPTDHAEGNTLNVMTPERLTAVLDDVFPAIVAPDEETAAQARALLHASHAQVLDGRYQEAFDSAAQLAELLPGVVDGHAQQIRVAIAAGSAEVGLASAEAALAIAPDSRELLLAAGTFAGDTGDHARAVRWLARLLEQSDGHLDGETVIAHQVLGSALDELDQVDAAIAHLSIAHAASPQKASTCQVLGYLYRRADDTDRAIACFERGLAIEPENAALLVNLAATYVECGRLEDAASTLERISAIAPDHPAVAALGQLLTETDPDAPPALVPRATRPEATHWIICDACPAHIPVASTAALLCAGCGSSLDTTPGPCPCCAAEGRVAPGLSMMFQCPFCRQGHVGLGT